MSTASQIFYCVAIPATLVLLVQTVLMLLGMGEGGGTEAEVGGDDLPDGVEGDGVFGEELPTEADDSFGIDGLRIFTLRGIVAFFVVFGWVGVAMDAAAVLIWITLLVAAVCGVVMMLVLAFLMRLVMKLRSDGTIDNRNAVGTAGKVYLTIPPSRTGEGKVQILLQGAFVERNAVTDDTEAIPTGCEVVVIGVSGQTDLVVKRK